MSLNKFLHEAHELQYLKAIPDCGNGHIALGPFSGTGVFLETGSPRDRVVSVDFASRVICTAG